MLTKIPTFSTTRKTRINWNHYSSAIVCVRNFLDKLRFFLSRPILMGGRFYDFVQLVLFKCAAWLLVIHFASILAPIRDDSHVSTAHSCNVRYIINENPMLSSVYFTVHGCTKV